MFIPTALLKRLGWDRKREGPPVEVSITVEALDASAFKAWLERRGGDLSDLLPPKGRAP
jgi:hypothetical protein